MLCERCKIREANIKYTEIINGVKTEHSLCSHCAKEMDFGQYAAILDGEFPLGKLLSGLLGLEDDQEVTDVRSKVVCPTCGTSFDDFVENSRFGCPDCYSVFDLFISDKMKQLQGSEHHKGKHPRFRSTFEKEHSSREGENGALVLQKAGDTKSVAATKQIRELETLLRDAVKKEEYELAAHCRDQLRELKKEGKP